MAGPALHMQVQSFRPVGSSRLEPELALLLLASRRPYHCSRVLPYQTVPKSLRSPQAAKVFAEVETVAEAMVERTVATTCSSVVEACTSASNCSHSAQAGSSSPAVATGKVHSKSLVDRVPWAERREHAWTVLEFPKVVSQIAVVGRRTVAAARNKAEAVSDAHACVLAAD